MLGARSQACCHAEAFTGTQRKIEGCWQQVAALIHPGTVSAQPPSFSVSLGAASIGAAGFRTRARGLGVLLGSTRFHWGKNSIRLCCSFRFFVTVCETEDLFLISHGDPGGGMREGALPKVSARSVVEAQLGL